MIPILSNLLRLNQMDMSPQSNIDQAAGQIYDRSQVPDFGTHEFATQPAITSQGVISNQQRSPLDFTPSTKAQDTLSQTINDMPSMPDPRNRSMFDRLTAGFVGAGDGYKAGQDVIYGQHDRDIRDFGVKAGLQQKVAADEIATNNTNRVLAVEAGKDADRDALREQNKIIADQKNELTSRLRDIEQQNADTRSHSAAIADFRAHNPNNKITTVGDQVVGINPQTGKSEVINGPDGKPLSAGKLSDAAKLEIQLHNRLIEIDEQGKQPSKSASGLGQVFQGPDGKTYQLHPTGEVTEVQLPTGSTRVPNAIAPPTVTTTETKVPPKNILGFNIPGTGGTTKATTVTKTPQQRTTGAPNAADIPLVNRVVDKTQAMVNGVLMTWRKNPDGHMGWGK